MKRMHTMMLLLAFTLLGAVAPAAFGQQLRAKNEKPQPTAAANSTAEVLRLEQEYNQAVMRLTADSVERFCADDFMMTVYVPPKVVTKADLLARFNDPNFKRGVIESLNDDDVKARVYGDTVIVTGHWKRVSKAPDGQDTSAEGRFTRVWIKQHGHWQLTAAHYSPIAELVKRR